MEYIHSIYGEDVKSRHSEFRAYIQFVNKTERNVDIVWIDYEGCPVRYLILKPTEFYKIDTYYSHPWFARDTVTHDPMFMASRPIYEPKPYFLYTNRDGSTNFNRILVNITVPVFTLRQRALQVVRDCLSSPSDVDELELPTTVKAEVKAALVKKNNING